MEKALRNCIIITIALPAHALDKSKGPQRLPKISARILHSSVRMKYTTLFQIPSPNGLIQRFDHKIRCQSVTHCPSYYLTGIYINDYCKIKPALQCLYIHDI